MGWAIMSRHRTFAWLGPALGPGLLMLAIGLLGAGRPVLSWDEIATADVASRTPGQIWRLILHVDGVFGPYYFFEHYWTRLAGTSELALRLPSILAMAGAVALVGELGRRLYGPATGVLAGVLLALLPNTSRYAAEARPYAFACFFALLAVLLLHRALDRPGAARWTGYALAVLFLGLSHVIALTTLAAHVLVLRRRGSRRTVKSWAAAAAPALMVLAPIFWLGVHQRDVQLSWVPPLSTGVLWKFPGDVAGSVAAGWLLLGFALLALCRPLPARAEVAALAAGPIVTLALMSLLVAPYWVARYLLVVLAPLALLAAAGLCDALAPEPPRRRPAAPVKSPPPPVRRRDLVLAHTGAHVPSARQPADALMPILNRPSAGTLTPVASAPGLSRPPADELMPVSAPPAGNRPPFDARMPDAAPPGLTAQMPFSTPPVSNRPSTNAQIPFPAPPVSNRPHADAQVPFSAPPVGSRPPADAQMPFLARPSFNRPPADAFMPDGAPPPGLNRPPVDALMPVAGPPGLNRPAGSVRPLAAVLTRRAGAVPGLTLLTRLTVIVALLACAVYPAQKVARNANSRAGSDYRTAAAIVQRYQLPGDGIVYSANSRTMRTGFLYYLRHDPAPPRDVLLSRTAADAALLRAVELPPTEGRLARTERLWLLVYGVHHDPLAARSDLRTLLTGHFRLDRIWLLHNETLAMYVRLPGR
jgi:hypothetical protein